MASGGVAAGKSLAAAQGGWICFEDESGQLLRPPIARTWSRRGVTPLVRIACRGSARVSLAGLACFRPGRRSRLLYRTRVHRGRRGEPKALTEADYAALLTTAHRRLGGPIVLVWDNLPTHHSRRMRDFLTAHADWLTVYLLPSYAPDLNPVEGLWSVLKTSMLANLAARGLQHLLARCHTGLRRLQHRPTVLDGCLAETGLALQPP